jgi:release factor glutamine methyltransferase
MEHDRLKAMIARRQAGEPLQYIIGNQDFYGHNFTVRPGVLIPRPETEGLVELSLATFDEYRRHGQISSDPVVLDFGTGSGCIGITMDLEIKRRWPRCMPTVLALETSDEAIGVAEENRARLKATGFSLIKSPASAAIEHMPNLPMVDVLVSNPPYLQRSDNLPCEVKNHEPASALYSIDQNDPCYFYRRLCELCLKHLKRTGFAAFETDENHAAETTQIFVDAGFVASQHKDLAGKWRYLLIKWP